MKGIMRKRLLALLSAAGLAGTAASAAAQAVKGSEPADKTQAASTIKSDKNKQENQATKGDAAVKMRKAGGEQQANKDVVSEKVGPDHIVHKHIAGVKYEKKTRSDAGSKDSSKMAKVSSENAATKDVVSEKDHKVQQDALTVKQKGTAHSDAAKTKQGKAGAESGASKRYEWIKATGKKQGGAQGPAAPKPTQETPK